MASKIFERLFNFFNFICILSIQFNGIKFSAPRSLQIKSVTAIFFVLLMKGILKVIDGNQEVEREKSEFKNLSFLFIYFVSFVTRIISIVPFLCAFILLVKQRRIADFFTNFYELKKFCSENKIIINEDILLKRIKKSCLIFFIITILSFDYIDLKLKRQIGLVELSQSIVNHILKTYYLLCLYFSNIILIYCEFLIENFTRIFDNQFELIHENCGNLLEKLLLIRKLIASIKHTFGAVFTIETVNELLVTIGFVSKTFCNV